MIRAKTTLFFIIANISIGLTNVSHAQEQDSHFLNVSINLFEMNLPDDPIIQKQQNIYPQVRSAEARYIPALLKATMQASNSWGAIRLVPVIDNSAELMISGSIIKSDGHTLELDITATDSIGKQWIQQVYRGESVESVSLNALNQAEQNNSSVQGLDPFQEVYNTIANDLSRIALQLSPAESSQLANLSFLRYGALLSPETFSPYIQQTEEGYYFYTNLPASNQPIAKRVEDIRQHEYLLIDVIDQQFSQYIKEVKPVYDIWRSYITGLDQDSINYQSRQNGNRDFNRGSYRDLRQSYENFRWEKMQQQYLAQLSKGFSNEVSDTQLSVDDRVYELSGTLENQYWEWQQILKALFELDSPAQ